MPDAARVFGKRKRAAGKQIRGFKPRPSACKRGYGRRWQAASKGFLRKNPLCAMCAGNDRVTAATLVDHIVPHRGDMKLFWKRDNWQGLCVTCHGIKTAKEDGGFGNNRV